MLKSSWAHVVMRQRTYSVHTAIVFSSTEFVHSSEWTQSKRNRRLWICAHITRGLSRVSHVRHFWRRESEWLGWLICSQFQEHECANKSQLNRCSAVAGTFPVIWKYCANVQWAHVQAQFDYTIEGASFNCRNSFSCGFYCYFVFPFMNSLANVICIWWMMMNRGNAQWQQQRITFVQLCHWLQLTVTRRHACTALVSRSTMQFFSFRLSSCMLHTIHQMRRQQFPCQSFGSEGKTFWWRK